MAKISLIDAKSAYNYVLANAGCTLPVRDAVDKRIIEQVKTGKINYVEGGKTGIGKIIYQTPLTRRFLQKRNHFRY